MALAASFNELCTALTALDEAFNQLRVAVHDGPSRGDSVLVDLFGDAADDLLGWSTGAAGAARAAQQAASYPLDTEHARWSLVAAQKTFDLIADRLLSDLLSYERISELTTLGRERRGEWLIWAGGVKSALDACREPLHNVHQALFLCWQEITEHLGTTSVSVQTTNVGQQISVPAQGQAKQSEIA